MQITDRQPIRQIMMNPPDILKAKMIMSWSLELFNGSVFNICDKDGSSNDDTEK